MDDNLLLAKTREPRKMLGHRLLNRAGYTDGCAASSFKGYEKNICNENKEPESCAFKPMTQAIKVMIA